MPCLWHILVLALSEMFVQMFPFLACVCVCDTTGGYSDSPLNNQKLSLMLIGHSFYAISTPYLNPKAAIQPSCRALQRQTKVFSV